MDQAGTFGKIDREWESQISSAFDQTGIQLIIAGSSQAKGRIERLWRTFQDRLIAELSFQGIKTIVDANWFLKEHFIQAYNLQFSVEAEEQESAYRKKCVRRSGSDFLQETSKESHVRERLQLGQRHLGDRRDEETTQEER